MLNKEKLQMSLLNNDEMKCTSGGGIQVCEKAGDTIFQKCVKLIGNITIVQCITFEASCPQTFTYGDNGGSCSANFTIKPAKIAEVTPM